MGTDKVTADATYLLERVKRLGQNELSERDMHVATQSKFKTKDTLMPAVSRLVDHGYLEPLPPMPIGGRPASPRYKLLATG